MVVEACLPSNAYYLQMPDYTPYSGIHVCWSEHSDSSFIYGFMSLDYGLGTMMQLLLTSNDINLYKNCFFFFVLLSLLVCFFTVVACMFFVDMAALPYNGKSESRPYFLSHW